MKKILFVLFLSVVGLAFVSLKGNLLATSSPQVVESCPGGWFDFDNSTDSGWYISDANNSGSTNNLLDSDEFVSQVCVERNNGQHEDSDEEELLYTQNTASGQCDKVEGIGTQQAKSKRLSCDDDIHKVYFYKSAVPTVTPTDVPPTVTPTPTDTPVHYLCREYSCVEVQGEGESECKYNEDCAPEVTVTPTETPCKENCGTVPTFPNNIPVAVNQCRDNPPKPAIALGGVRVDNDTVKFQWLKSTDGGVSHQLLQYGFSKDNLAYGIPKLDPNAQEVEVNGLDGNHWWFMVITERNFCQSFSEVVDP